MNPNSKIPAMVDLDGPDGKPLAIFESAAILIYLAEKTGKFLPRHGAQRYTVLSWLEWQMGGIGPMFGQTNHFFNVHHTHTHRHARHWCPSFMWNQSTSADVCSPLSLLPLPPPFCGQYAPEQVPYAQKRYLTESKRLMSVLDAQLAKHAYLAGADYSIADIVRTHHTQAPDT